MATQSGASKPTANGKSGASEKDDEAGNTDNKGANVEDLSAQIDKIRADMSELSRILGGIAGGKTDELRSIVSSRLSEAEVQGREALARAEDQFTNLNRDAEAYVRRNPVQALAMAAGLGIVLGWLSRR